MVCALSDRIFAYHHVSVLAEYRKIFKLTEHVHDKPCMDSMPFQAFYSVNLLIVLLYFQLPANSMHVKFMRSEEGPGMLLAFSLVLFREIHWKIGRVQNAGDILLAKQSGSKSINPNYRAVRQQHIAWNLLYVMLYYIPHHSRQPGMYSATVSRSFKRSGDGFPLYIRLLHQWSRGFPLCSERCAFHAINFLILDFMVPFI